jgi:dTDP-4-amino-4,6-dideoxy-D-glucose acyltransferase
MTDLKSPQYDLRLLKKVGDDVFISANVEIRRPNLVQIGAHVAIDTGFYCTTQMNIGSYIHIAPYTTVIGGAKGLLQMGNFTTIAAGSRIICGSDEHLGFGLVGPTIPEPYKDKIYIAPVTFEDFASVGTNVVIMPGVTLGEGSVVGSCSLVTKSTDPWAIYVGTPARPIKTRPRDKMIEISKKLGF